MNRLTVFLFILCISVMGASTAHSRVVTIGVALDGPGERSDELLTLFRSELSDLMGGEFDLRFPETKIFRGEWTPESVHTALDRALTAPEVDIVLALGYIAGQDAAHRSVLSRPVEAPMVYDADIQTFPSSGAGSGLKNLQYIVSASRMPRDMEAFHTLLPFKKVSIVIDHGFHDAVPGFESFARECAGKSGAEAAVVNAGNSADAVLKAVPPDADAVYILPLQRFTPKESERLASGLRERKLPSFSSMGMEDVRRGFLLGLTSEERMRHIARRAALNLRTMILGNGAGSLPVDMAEAGRLTINMKTAGIV
jgi:outer membrane protein